MDVISKMTDTVQTSTAAFNTMQERMDRLSGYLGFAQSTGTKTPWLNPTTLPKLSNQQMWQYQNFNDPRVRSMMMQQGIDSGALSPELGYANMQVEPNTGLPYGTTQPYAQNRRSDLFGVTAAQVGWTPGMYGLGTMSQLPSLQFLQTKQNELQLQQQRQQQTWRTNDLYNNNTQFFGGQLIAADGGVGPTIMGSQYWSAQSAGLSAGHAATMNRLQAGTLNYAWAGGPGFDTQGWGGAAYSSGGLQGLQSLLGSSGALGGASIDALGSAGTGYRQALENMEFSKRWGGIMRGFAAADVGANLEKQRTQLDWAEADLRTNYGRQTHAIRLDCGGSIHVVQSQSDANGLAAPRPELQHEPTGHAVRLGHGRH